VNGKEVALLIDQPELVVLKQKDGAIELELICGKQTGQSIAAEYEPTGGGGTAGLLRVLVVR